MTVDALLYDAEGADKQVDVSGDVLTQLSGKQLLWIDVEDDGNAEAPQLAGALCIEDRIITRVLDRERPP